MLFLALLACTPDPDLRWEADESIPTVLHLSWTSAEPGVASVVYGPSDGRWERTTPVEEQARTEHSIVVAGLPAGEESLLLPRTVTSSGEVQELEPVVVSVDTAPVTRFTTSGAGVGDVLTHLITPEREDTVVVMDRSGAWTWWSQPEDGPRTVLSARIDPSDATVWYGAHETDFVETLGVAHQVSLDGSISESWEIERMHSGLVPLPEGGFAYLRKQSAQWEGKLLLYDEIWEHTPEGSERQVFSIYDHFEVELLCAHQNAHSPELGEIFDWTHANSLLLSDDQSAYFVMVRYFDAILKIDRASGELEWVLGGPYGDFDFEEEGDAFGHAHMSQQTPEGFLLFDNRNHDPARVSRIMRYAVDEEARTARVVWSYIPPEEYFNSLLGDAKLLPGGDYLISWSEQGLLRQVGPEGEVLWEARAPMGMGTGRVSLVQGYEP